MSKNKHKNESPNVDNELQNDKEDIVVEDIESQIEDIIEENDDEKQQLAAKLDETTAALEKEKKEYLFLMADFDNFRKRVVKEKAELIKNAAEKTLRDLLPIVDDFERGLQATDADTDAADIHKGMELIYNKLIKFLADHSVKAMDTTDADFNADLHEAIATIPAPDETKKGKIIDTTQKGYLINDKVLRHAKVVVGE